MDAQSRWSASQDVLCFGPFRLTASERVLEKEGIPVRLGSRALDILIALVERPAEVVTKKELFARVWPDLVVDEGNLRYQVSALRKALGEGRSDTRGEADRGREGRQLAIPHRDHRQARNGDLRSSGRRERERERQDGEFCQNSPR